MPLQSFYQKIDINGKQTDYIANKIIPKNFRII